MSESFEYIRKLKAYKAADYTLLLLSFYLITFPFSSPYLAKVFPGIWGRCGWNEIIGSPCCFCGLTKELSEAYSSIAHGENPHWSFRSLSSVTIFSLFITSRLCSLIILSYAPKIRNALYLDAALSAALLGSSIVFVALAI